MMRVEILLETKRNTCNIVRVTDKPALFGVWVRKTEILTSIKDPEFNSIIRGSLVGEAEKLLEYYRSHNENSKR